MYMRIYIRVYVYTCIYICVGYIYIGLCKFEVVRLVFFLFFRFVIRVLGWVLDTVGRNTI